MHKILFNIDKGSLSKHKLGDEVGAYCGNSDKGYAMNSYRDDLRLSNIVVYFRKGYGDFNVFNGSIMINGNEYHFDKHTTFEEITSAFGSSDNQWNDGVEMCVEYNKKGVNRDFDIEIIWHVDGEVTLDYISVELAG